MTSTLTRHGKAFRFALLAEFVFLNVLSTYAGTLIGSFSPIATGSNVNLTAVGKLDWIHWGLYTDTSINRKHCASLPIGDFSVAYDTNNQLAYAQAYQYTDNYNGYTWYDGQPTISVTNTTTGVYAYGYPTLGTGFEFSVPADTTQRTLQVFVGVFSGTGTFEASLSDNSATTYSNSSLANTFGNGPGAVYTITYSANSAGQSLKIRWTLTLAAGANAASANVTLQAAALTESGANNPPFAVLTNPTNGAAFSEPADIALNATAQDFDGTVTNVAFYSGTTKIGEKATAPYNMTWSSVPRGLYTLTALATDNQGATSCGVPVDVFVYGTGGSLAGSVATPPAGVNLTSEGTADWIHWGLLTNSSVDRKSGVAPQISTFTALGTNAIQRYTNNYTSFAWTDGTPTPATNTITGVFITGATNGFELSLPADTSSRTARLYVGGYGMQAGLEAFLSDMSAPPYIDGSVSSVYGDYYAVYTLTYAAASAGQTLNVIYHTQDIFDYDYGNVTLQAVSLQGQIPVVPFSITNASRAGGDFIMSFNTQTGHTYTAQYAGSLPSPGWTNFATLPGTGTILTVTNYSVPPGERFYRVQAQ